MILGRRRRPRGAGIILLLAACADGRTAVLGEVSPDTRTLIVGLSQDGQLEASATTAEQALELELPTGFDPSAPFVVSRVQLRENMAELGLDGPALRPAPPPHRPLSSLPAISTEAAEVSIGETASFSAGPIAVELADFRLPDPKPCPRFSFDPMPLGLDFSLSTLTLPDGRAVLVSLRGLAILGGEPMVRTLRFESEIIYGLALDPNGDAWLLTDHDLSRVDLVTGDRTSWVDTSSIAGGGAALLVTSADPLRAYIFHPSSVIYVVEDRALRLHHRLDPEYLGRPHVDRMWFADRGGGAFLAGGHYFTALAEFDGREYTYFRAPGVPRGFAGIGRLSDGRFVVADSFDGTAYVRNEAGWVSGPKLSTRIFSFATFGAGNQMIYASNEGLVGVFGPEEVDPCDPVPVGTFAGVRDVVRVGERYFLSGSLGDNTSLEGWLVPE